MTDSSLIEELRSIQAHSQLMANRAAEIIAKLEKPGKKRGPSKADEKRAEIRAGRMRIILKQK